MTSTLDTEKRTRGPLSLNHCGEQTDADNPWMRIEVGLAALASIVLPCAALRAAGPPPAKIPVSLAGEWELDERRFDCDIGFRMMLEVDGEAISGWIYDGGDRNALKGTVHGLDLTFDRTPGGGVPMRYAGRMSGDRMSGTLEWTPLRAGGVKARWSAKRPAARPSTPPRTVEFEPAQFHREFSARVPPALSIWPGDVVHTRSVDAGGWDEKGVRRAYGGNPLTGPFYVEGSMPGDVLVVTFVRVRLNRPMAFSGNTLVDRVVTPGYATERKDSPESVTYWHLDLEHGLASLEKPSESLKAFTVRVRPMVGCVGVAPYATDAALSAGDSGRIGGNMDFNLVEEGTTVYLPVNVPGALLYVGDGHAVQGDGELTGSALETSLDLGFKTEVIHEKVIRGPRLESSEYLMAMGLDGSMEAALRFATTELARWLSTDFALSSNDVALVLGPSVEYAISEVADPKFGVVAKIRKAALSSLPRALPRAQ
jgi:amidase